MEPDLKERPSLLDRITRKEGPEEPREAIKDMRPALPTPMLDIVFKSGHIESFSYAYLTRISFDPRGRMQLHFGEDIVAIEGRNLREVRQKIRMHRADEVIEGSEAEDALKPESAAHIERIHITKEQEGVKEAPRDGHDRSKGLER